MMGLTMVVHLILKSHSSAALFHRRLRTGLFLHARQKDVARGASQARREGAMNRHSFYDLQGRVSGRAGRGAMPSLVYKPLSKSAPSPLIARHVDPTAAIGCSLTRLTVQAQYDMKWYKFRKNPA